MSDRAAIDLKTFGLFALFVGLLSAGGAMTARGIVPLWAGGLIGLAAFNLTFTIWHESVHNTISTSRAFCTIVGVATSFFMFLPGYFTLRREHLMHHKYQGDPERDPVYPRVQCRPWLFPLRLLLVVLWDPQPANPERRLSWGERIVDGLTLAAFLAAAGGAAAAGYAKEVLAVWIAPRLLIAPIHAFYVCFLPHAAGGPEFYRTFRIVLRNPFTRYLTMYHSFHGLHHLWPNIPWHRYRRVFNERRAELESQGVEILG